MATNGTPYEGIDSVIVPAVYTSSLKARVYTNTANSLSQSSVLADITVPTGTGTTDITLSGTFSSSDGVVTYDHGTPDNPKWTAGDNWSANVTGICIHNGTYLLHFKDLTDGAVTMTTGKELELDLSTLIS